MTGSSLARPEIQAELLSEALVSATVGFIVWDEDRRTIAANKAACDILGATLEELLARRAGEQSAEALETIDAVLRSGFSTGTAEVERFDGSGRIEVFYATFATKAAGMPYMGTLLARLP